MGIKDDIKEIIDKDYFDIGGAGIQKVRINNILAFIGGSTIAFILYNIESKNKLF